MTELKAELQACHGYLKRDIPLRSRKIKARFILIAKRPSRSAWSMSLLLNDIRADGIDWHTTANTDTEGVRRIGWHRHIWDAKRKNGNLRQRLHAFNPATVESFIIEGLEIMKIILNLETDDDDAHLLFH